MMRHKILLGASVISMAINLAVLGFAVARMIHEPPQLGSQIHISPRWAHHLPDERRKELRPLLKEQFQRARAQRPMLRDKHKAVKSALAADNFSDKALTQALLELRIALQASQSQSHADFSLFVQELSTGERKDLAEQLTQRGRRGDHSAPRHDR